VAERMGGSVLQPFGGATKNIKIEIRRGLTRLQNVLKNATINKKRAASMKGRRDGMRARWRVQGECDLIVLGAIELGEGGKHK
jgi:hypothetical protein